MEELKVDMPLRWRRLTVARDMLKDIAPSPKSGKELHFGRPATLSSIFHSGAEHKNNVLNRDRAISKNRVDPEHLKQPKLALAPVTSSKHTPCENVTSCSTVAWPPLVALPHADATAPFGPCAGDHTRARIQFPRCQPQAVAVHKAQATMDCTPTRGRAPLARGRPPTTTRGLIDTQEM